ncbi:heterokaryon incompatibility [Cercophora newfieldiana]|uniref:Heterokaryon incompatibility n=1 Tax=Cercophora newfieldiana TaxID=92897 RepID=A0AA39Y1H1_9PEZI|nr:heterokaryon incompatibility [Cercophora newfieldiana]
MPKTILHATQLTRILGGKHLWADRFCIIQDEDTELKQAQLNAMADIYAGAEAVIIAASGDDAESGLNGIPGVSAPRNLASTGAVSDAIPCDFVHEVGRRELMHDQARSMMLANKKWYWRGWTFQEQMSSCRKIVFQDGTVN